MSGSSGSPASDLQIRTDVTAREAATGDFGGIIRHRPCAVVKVADIDQVRAAVGLAVERGWKVAIQGQRHSTYGEAQARDGLALSTTGLDHIRIDPPARRVDVGAGTRWDALIRCTLRHGLIPPVLTDYLGLSVGGTLSVGGIGGASFRAGTQTDHVGHLTVVTGTGDAVRCSEEQNRDLFDGVRGGLGRLGVIVSARLHLVTAPALVRTCKALYTDLTEMIDDQRRLTARSGIGSIQGFAIPNAEPYVEQRFGSDLTRRLPTPDIQPWLYQIKIAIPEDAGRPRRVTGDLLADLSVAPKRWVTEVYTALEFADRMAPDVRKMRDLGLWRLPHPYLSVFLPAAQAPQVIAAVLDARPPSEQHEGPVIIHVLIHRALRTPNLRLPQDEHLVLFSLLPNAQPPTQARIRSMLAANRRIYDTARRAGGTLYPVGSLPTTDDDRTAHRDLRLPQQGAAKHRHDPHNVFGEAHRPARPRRSRTQASMNASSRHAS